MPFEIPTVLLATLIGVIFLIGDRLELQNLEGFSRKRVSQQSIKFPLFDTSSKQQNKNKSCIKVPNPDKVWL